MAEIALFHYQTRETALHRYDPRHKLPLLILMVALLFHTGAWGLLFLSALLAAGGAIGRLSLGDLFRGLLPLGLLILAGFLAEALTVPGAKVIAWLPATWPGLATGGFLAWRLAAVVLLGTLFTATTSIRDLRAAIVWYLRPFPRLHGGRIATMIGLTISLIPLIFDTQSEISDALRSRCIERSGRFVRRAGAFAAPLIIKTFTRADEIVQAMEARCYTDDRTVARLCARGADWIVTLFVGGAAIGCLVLFPG